MRGGQRLSNGYRIREIAHEERPRERLLAVGAKKLANAELLAIILRTGRPGASAIQVAHELLRSTDGLRGLADASLEELSEIPGIGIAKAVQLKASFELGRRVAARRHYQTQILSPQDAAGLLLEETRLATVEHFYVILLNTKNNVLAVELVSVGGLDVSLAHPREVFKPAIRRSASSIILAHNHPSGEPTPSPEDIEISKRLAESGKLLGIPVLDHLILGDGKYVSLREQGLAF